MGTATPPKITVIIPTYRSGAVIQRPVGSLDAQTLAADEFEVVLVDDGSPDDTYRRLQDIAATRPNYRVTQIAPSGWPSRPRNVATQLARGEYVFYLDHDDTLYPDALRRLVEFGEQTGADLISPKESKTSDAWWSMAAMAAGNAADIKAEHRIRRLVPMFPHKAYRREFLLENQITFLEGGRVLWEDFRFNVGAYAKASRVAILADTPVHLWHDEGSHLSSSYPAASAEYWDNQHDLMAFLDKTLAGPELAKERRTMLMHNYETRVLRRPTDALQYADAVTAEFIVRRARAIQDAFIPRDWDAGLPTFSRIRAHLLRAGRGDLLSKFREATSRLSARTTLTSVKWVEGVLQIKASARWHRRGKTAPGLARDGERVLLTLPRQPSDELPDDLLDVTDKVKSFSPRFGVRANPEDLTWQLPASVRVKVVPGVGAEFVLVAHATARLDPATAACGKPLPDTVWDLVTMTRWEGLFLSCLAKASTRPLPALIDGRAAVAYTNHRDGLSLDLAHRQHSVVLDADIEPGVIPDSAQGFVIPLREVHVSGDTRRTIELALDEPTASEPTSSPARLVATVGTAHLEITGPVPVGRHRLRVCTGAATLSGNITLQMSRNGLLQITGHHAARRSARQAQRALRRQIQKLTRLARWILPRPLRDTLRRVRQSLRH